METPSLFPPFGWTNGHLAGTPLPNFYPPPFFRCVAFLMRTDLFSFMDSLRVDCHLAAPSHPSRYVVFGLVSFEKKHHLAFWSASVSMLALTSAHFGGQLLWTSRLDYVSTLSIGMYRQPLGFVLLLVKYAVYFEVHRRPSRFVMSGVLRARAVLANYLNVSTRSLDANA